MLHLIVVDVYLLVLTVKKKLYVMKMILESYFIKKSI